MPEKKAPCVSVVVPCRNEVKVIGSVLKSILAQEEVEGGFEVIVADGASTDGTTQLLEETQTRDPRIRVIPNPAQIVSTGLNAAIRTARGAIIVRMDAHTDYAPDYIRRCLEALEETQADNVGGPARTKASTYVGRAVGAAYHSPMSVGGALFHNVDYQGWVDTVTYGCWRRSVFERFGYFDEELVRNQDDEHNLRLIRNGGRIWQTPQIRSWYQPRGSLAALFHQYNQYGYWKVRVIRKHGLPASWRQLVPAAFLLTLLSLLLLLVFNVLLRVFVSLPSSVVTRQWAVVPLVSLFSLYAFVVVTASVLTAAKSEWKLLPILPLVFPCYHFGYGFGFLRGLWDFLIRRRGHRPGFAALTR